MVSIAKQIPVYDRTGFANRATTFANRDSVISSVSSYGEDGLRAGDSDIDTDSTLNVIHIGSKNRQEPATTNPDKKDCLLQWLMAQIEQKDGVVKSAESCHTTDAAHSDTVQEVKKPERLSASSPRLPGTVDQAQSNHEAQDQIGLGLSNLRTKEHYFPRLPRSRDQSRELLVNQELNFQTSNPRSNVDRLLTNLKNKALGINGQNAAINEQLYKAENIIHNWNAQVTSETGPAVDRITGMAVRGPCSQQPDFKATPMGSSPIFLDSSENRVVPTSGNTLFERSRSAQPYFGLRTPVPTRLHQSPLYSNQFDPFLRNDHTITENYNNHPTLSEATMSSGLPVQKSLRRYSVAHDHCIQKMATPSKPNLGTTDQLGSAIDNQEPWNNKFPKRSWFHRALSQVSLFHRDKSPPKQRPILDLDEDDSRQDSRSMIQPRLLSLSRPTKWISTSVLHPFHRKTSAPGLSPMLTSQPAGVIFLRRNRCISLGQLLTVGKDNQTGRPLNCPNESSNSHESRMRSAEFLDTDINKPSYFQKRYAYARKNQVFNNSNNDAGDYFYTNLWNK